jgi:hypothetical protein
MRARLLRLLEPLRSIVFPSRLDDGGKTIAQFSQFSPHGSHLFQCGRKAAPLTQ